MVFAERNRVVTTFGEALLFIRFLQASRMNERVSMTKGRLRGTDEDELRHCIGSGRIRGEAGDGRPARSLRHDNDLYPTLGGALGSVAQVGGTERSQPRRILAPMRRRTPGAVEWKFPTSGSLCPPEKCRTLSTVGMIRYLTLEEKFETRGVHRLGPIAFATAAGMTTIMNR